MSTLNVNFPRPRESDQLDEIEEATSESSVAQFLYESIFPSVIIVRQQHPYPFLMLPPPTINSVITGQGDGGQDSVTRRRRLSFLGNILQSC
jgi:hypothetical protein